MTGRAGPPRRSTLREAAVTWRAAPPRRSRFRKAEVTWRASCTNRRQAARRQSRGRTQRRGVHASGCAIGSVATRTASGFPLPVESPDGSTQLNRHHWEAVSRWSFRQGSEPRGRVSGARPRRRRRDEARRRAGGERLLERVEQATGSGPGAATPPTVGRACGEGAAPPPAPRPPRPRSIRCPIRGCCPASAFSPGPSRP